MPLKLMLIITINMQVVQGGFVLWDFKMKVSVCRVSCSSRELRDCNIPRIIILREKQENKKHKMNLLTAFSCIWRCRDIEVLKGAAFSNAVNCISHVPLQPVRERWTVSFSETWIKLKDEGTLKAETSTSSLKNVNCQWEYSSNIFFSHMNS